MYYTDLLIALQNFDPQAIRIILSRQKVKVFLPGEGSMIRSIEYGPDGDLQEFFSSNHPSIRKLRGIIEIVKQAKQITTLSDTSNFDVAEQEVKANIVRVENKILCLMGIYVASLVTFIEAKEGIFIFFAATTAIIATMYCKHATSPCDFLGNIRATFHDKIVEPICISKLHSKIHTHNPENDSQTVVTV